jgi:outer membrane cobalamin receptor
MKAWRCSLLAVIVFVTPGVCFAEEARKSSGAAVTMDEVVVTGTRSEEKAEKIPANVTVIDQKILRTCAKSVRTFSGPRKDCGA